MRRAQRVVEDVSVGEVMSLVSHFISLGILGQISTKEEKRKLSMMDPQPKAEGRVQETRKVEDL